MPVTIFGVYLTSIIVYRNYNTDCSDLSCIFVASRDKNIRDCATFGAVSDYSVKNVVTEC